MDDSFVSLLFDDHPAIVLERASQMEYNFHILPNGHTNVSFGYVPEITPFEQAEVGDFVIEITNLELINGCVMHHDTKKIFVTEEVYLRWKALKKNEND